MKKKQKRPFLLLEVVIAIALISLSLIPLVAPNVVIAKARRQFVQKIDLDRASTELYARVIEDLYLKKIPFSAVESGQKFPISKELVNQLTQSSFPLPYEGYYSFLIEKEDKGAYLINLKMTFFENASKKSEEFNFLIFAYREKEK